MAKSFLGRQNELDKLNKAYNKSGFQMCILYGRRRVGKTTLINEFIKNKNSIFFTAIQNNIEKNISLFAKEVLNYFLPELKGAHFTKIEDILNIITQNVKEEKLILVIDELPYLVESDKSFLSLLQAVIDNKWLNKNIFLILCGSSVSFMEQEVLSSKSPIFGRRTLQIDLKAFNYLEVAQFVPNYTPEEKAICFGVTGGIAKYIAMFDSNKSLDQNIIDLFFSTTAYLYEEPHNLLIQEFRNVSIYADVIDAIASGVNKAVELKDKTKLESASLHNVLNNLIQTRIVVKMHCITDEKNNKKNQYRLTDGMFLFWYKFINNAISLIESDKGEEYYYSFVKPKLHEYMGLVFEDICKQYLLQKSFDKNMHCTVTEVGKWMGTNPAKKEQTDIDIVALDKINNKAILCECKFTNCPIDKNVYESLCEKNNLIDKKYSTVAYFLFSLSGFSDWIKQNANKQQIYAISVDDLY